jgi:hypothetical protein
LATEIGTGLRFAFNELLAAATGDRHTRNTDSQENRWRKPVSSAAPKLKTKQHAHQKPTGGSVPVEAERETEDLAVRRKSERERRSLWRALEREPDWRVLLANGKRSRAAGQVRKKNQLAGTAKIIWRKKNTGEGKESAAPARETNPQRALSGKKSWAAKTKTWSG